MRLTTRFSIWVSMLLLMAVAAAADPVGPALFFYGNEQNDLYRLLQREGYTIKKFESPEAAIQGATRGAGVFLLADHYPEKDPRHRITSAMLDLAAKKKLKLYIEYPTEFPGLNIPEKPVETRFERGVITTRQFGKPADSLSLMAIHDSHILSVEAEHPLIVLAKVVGFDKAELGLANTKMYPLLFEKNHALVCMTGLSNFTTGRYGPDGTVQAVWKYILKKMTGNSVGYAKKWQKDVKPMFSKTTPLPANARAESIRKGVAWFNNGRFFVDPAWKEVWEKYGSNGLEPLGPPLSPDKPNGNGNLGIIEGHTSTIYTNGDQQYRYWMRADVQGEVSMALAGASQFLHNKDYAARATNLIDYMFNTSNMRSGPKNDPASPAYGLIGWATTNAGTFYGDDNARAILGAIAAAAYLDSDKWDQQLAEAIMGNFRTTGTKGFRGERLEEPDIIRNGWPHYYNKEVMHVSPHFESWMWACYLWLYHKTAYKPLLERTKEAIRITMESYPDKWLWGSSLQTQRARMILPLAWLVRVEDTPQHRQWLDRMVKEIIRYQDESGAIREEIGKGKGRFKELSSNNDYGSDEGSLIFRNGEKASCMLYTCNFALFSLHEAARATNNPTYKTAVNKLSDFLTRVQVQSTKHKDLDGAWFRGFDFGRWEYWGSNSDAGWGVWCTLTGWIQSWIVVTQVQLQQKQSFWELTERSSMGNTGKAVIASMMNPPSNTTSHQTK